MKRFPLVWSPGLAFGLVAGASDLPGTAPSPEAPGYESLLLELHVNGNVQNGLIELEKAKGSCHSVSTQPLAHAGVYSGKAASACLETIPGIDYRIDRAAAILHVFTRTDPKLKSVNAVGLRTYLPPEPGVIGTYSLSVQHVHDGEMSEWNGFGNLALSFHAPEGRIENDLVLVLSGGESRLTRLRTVYERDFPNRLTSLSLGDSFTRTPNWGRAVPFAGIQYGTDFSMDPDGSYRPFQVLEALLRDEAQVDISLNGNVRKYHGVQPGSTEFGLTPQTGLNDVELVIRENTGITRIENFSFFTSPTSLSEGRSDYVFSLGMPRRYVGVDSEYLETVMGSFYHRYGVSDYMTTENFAEFGQSGLMLGTGAQISHSSLGLFRISGAMSRSSEVGSGALVSVGYERNTRNANVQLQARFAEDNFQDVVNAFDVPFPDRTLRASIGVATDYGSFRATFQDERDADLRDRSFLSLSWDKPLPDRGAALFSSAYHDLQSDESGLTLGFRMQLGNVTGQINRTEYSGGDATNLQLSGISGVGDQLHWTLHASDGSIVDTLQGHASYISDSTEAFASAGSYGDVKQAAVGLRGTIAFAGGEMKLARHSGTSSALVDTKGVEGVEIYHDGRPVGATNEKGLLLVSNLRAYEANRLSVRPDALSLDYELDDFDQTVRPMRGIVRVGFDIQQTNSLAFTIIQPDGTPYPMGAFAKVVETGEFCPVGYDGRAFCERVLDRHTIEVQAPYGYFVRSASALRANPLMRLINDQELRVASSE